VFGNSGGMSGLLLFDWPFFVEHSPLEAAVNLTW
jgi:hypothetical protein